MWETDEKKISSLQREVPLICKYENISFFSSIFFFMGGGKENPKKLGQLLERQTTISKSSVLN